MIGGTTDRPYRRVVLATLLTAAGLLIGAPGARAARRIINGGSQVTTAGAWPWAVGVVATSGQNVSTCSGVLIGPTVALTAAHCVDPNVVGPSPTFQVTTARNMNTGITSGNSVSATATEDSQFDLNHPENGSDLAVLTLAHALPGANYLPVVQPGQISPFQPSLDGLIAGYGLTSANNFNSGGVLNQTEVHGADYQSAAPAFITDSASPGYACEGDSGAPLIVSLTGSSLPVTSDPMPSNGRWAVIGVVSFGSNGCSGQEAYTAVADYPSFLSPHETPVNFVRPKVMGVPIVGKALSCSAGTWSTTITPTYQWETTGRAGAGSPISGAHGQAFTPGKAQAGKRLECLVTATASGFGAPIHATSAATSAVAKARPTLAMGAPSADRKGIRIAASSLSATLAKGFAPTGRITVIVFGPRATAPTSCASGGTAVGGATVSGNRIYHPSAGLRPGAVGSYWWYARYTGDAGNAVAASPCGRSMAKTVVKR